MLQHMPLNLLTLYTWGCGEKPLKSSDRKGKLDLVPICTELKPPMGVLPSQTGAWKVLLPPALPPKAVGLTESKGHLGWSDYTAFPSCCRCCFNCDEQRGLSITLRVLGDGRKKGKQFGCSSKYFFTRGKMHGAVRSSHLKQ